MPTYNARQLMAGFSAFTTVDEVAASPIEGEGVSITLTPTTPALTVTTTSTTGPTTITVSTDGMLHDGH
jgi:hypothetical protein